MFLWNNVHQGARFRVEDLLALDKEREFRYAVAGKHYLATATVIERWKGSCVSIVVRCRLPEIAPQDRTWVPGKFMDDISKYFCGAGFWYSATPDSMAFALGPRDMRNLLCTITFVRGEPFVDDLVAPSSA